LDAHKEFCPLLALGGSLNDEEMTESQELLAQYAATRSEEAFREVVNRYVNLVYSTAVRLVNGDSHLAEDVTQRVFADLAKMASALSKDVMPGGWLHRHTCYVAQKTMRTERRRKAREEQAVQMNEIEDCSAANFAVIAPILDEAINKLGADERQAIVLRYFEEKDFRSVGAALGSSEEAARKRVNRALDKLRTVLLRRGVTLSAAGLAALLEAQAVSAAPAGIAVGMTAAALATASAGGGTALTTLYFMSITKFQTGLIAVITLALSIPLVMQHRAQAKLREENQALRAQAEQVEGLRTENARLAKLVPLASNAASTNNDAQFRELMRLRGEVGTLRKTANQAEATVNAGKTSPLSGITANPEMSKVIRDQQKLGLSMVYKDFGKRTKLAPEKLEALNELLADEVMIGIDHVTAGLRDGKSTEEMDQLFTRQEAETEAKVKALIGDEAFNQYQEYNRNLVSSITADQFKGMMLKGEKESKEAKAKQLYELLEQEKQRALAGAGLAADYQLVPTLNFRNFASDEFSERNLKLLDSMYEQVQNQAGGFLSPEEVEKFGEFRKLAINNNRLALTVNRKLMAPAAASK
jgi:RNA polymerase sigma factor (sigma-70 family)